MLNKNLVWVGRLDVDKNFDLFVRISIIFKRKFLNSLVYGDGIGKYDPRLKDPFFKLMGHVRNPWENISSNDIFVMTSKSECRPLALKEAINNRMSVVVGNLEVGMRELCCGYDKLFISKSWNLLDFLAAVEKAALGIDPDIVTWNNTLEKVAIKDIGRR